MSNDNKKKSRLGLGTNSFFGEGNISNYDEIIKKETKNKPVIKVSISRLTANPNQPRKTFDKEALNKLAKSLDKDGLIQNIVINKHNQIVVGERRTRAAKLLGWEEIDAKVLDISPEESAIMAITENINREDMNPIEEAMAYEALVNNYGLKQQEIADRFHKSRSQVANLIRLLKLPKEVQQMLINNEITVGHAKELLSGDNDVEKITEKAKVIIKEKKTIKQLGKEKNIKNNVNAGEIYLNKINCKLETNGKKIVLTFKNESDLNNLVKYLKNYK